MSVTTLTQAATWLTEPLVHAGFYASPTQALQHIILDYIDRQIAVLEADCQRYERTYQATFAEWTAILIDYATPSHEDAWMEWEAARDILEAWQLVKQQNEIAHAKLGN